MSEQNDELRDKQDALQKTFGLSPETAQATAEDSLADGMRRPSSDSKEGERIAAAQTTDTDDD